MEDDLLLLGDDPLDLIDGNTAHSALEEARPHDQDRRLTIGAKADVIHRAEALIGSLDLETPAVPQPVGAIESREHRQSSSRG